MILLLMNLIVNKLLQYLNDSLKVGPWIHIQEVRFFHIESLSVSFRQVYRTVEWAILLITTPSFYFIKKILWQATFYLTLVVFMGPGPER